jgi:hypothetical protein
MPRLIPRLMRLIPRLTRGSYRFRVAATWIILRVKKAAQKSSVPLHAYIGKLAPPRHGRRSAVRRFADYFEPLDDVGSFLLELPGADAPPAPDAPEAPEEPAAPEVPDEPEEPEEPEEPDMPDAPLAPPAPDEEPDGLVAPAAPDEPPAPEEEPPAPEDEPPAPDAPDEPELPGVMLDAPPLEGVLEPLAPVDGVELAPPDDAPEDPVEPAAPLEPDAELAPEVLARACFFALCFFFIGFCVSAEPEPLVVASVEACARTCAFFSTAAAFAGSVLMVTPLSDDPLEDEVAAKPAIESMARNRASEIFFMGISNFNFRW